MSYHETPAYGFFLKYTAVQQVRTTSFVLAVLLCIACNKNTVNEYPELDQVVYQASDEVIPNPERGFYSAAGISDASKTGLSVDGVNSARKQGRTLYLFEFYLTDFVNSDISDDFLQCIRRYFQSLRDNGAKCILRFLYSNGSSEKDKPWDATPAQVMSHVAQLKPLIQEYYDVIMVVQAGFVGSWGEWYYTDNFGDGDDPSRKALVDALLDAVPAQRQIELRTPAYKMNLYGYQLADTITRATAHQATTLARIGGHNDCYLASANDTGTYHGETERKYWAAESLYTIMGGETCGLSAYCHCQPEPNYQDAHGVLQDMAIYHFTYLNQGYHSGVLSRWRKEGCYEEIQKRLGYRYVLEKAFFSKEPAAGSEMRVVLKIRNDGFAPAQNPRDAEFVLTDNAGKVIKTWPLDSDPRYWMPGQTTVIDQNIELPSGASGQCTLSLNLPDPCEKLRNNSRFSIRLANENIWEEETGLNKLTSISL